MTYETKRVGARIASGALSVLLVAAFCLVLRGFVNSAIVPGDADCDGRVDMGDVTYLVDYIFCGGPAPCAVTDTVAVTDTLMLRSYVLTVQQGDSMIYLDVGLFIEIKDFHFIGPDGSGRLSVRDSTTSLEFLGVRP